MPVVNLTEARIRDLPLGSGIHRDEQVKGLMVLCHASTKTYAVQGDVRRNGRHVRTVRVKIDRCDRIGLREARTRAKALMSTIQSGVDPTAGPAESGITVKQALEAHLGEKTYSPRTAEAYRYHLDHYLTRIRNRAVTDITRQEVRDLFDGLKKQRGETTAAGAMRTLRAAINTAMRMDETIGSNPVAALRVPSPKPRQVKTWRSRGEGPRYHVIQNYALLVKGDQGTGKSWIGRLMARIIGMPNVVFPANSEVMSNWTAWTEGAQLAVIEELMAMGRLEMANRLKPIITEPFLRIEAKNCNLYSIPNRLNLIAFTNHDDAVPIERGDRRWLVAFSDAKPRDDAYYERIFSFLESDGPAAVKDWLLRREVKLKAKGTAPATRGKDVMRRLSLGEAEQYLAEHLEEGAAPFAFDLLRFEDVIASVPPDIGKRSKGLRDRVTRWLRDGAGAVKHSRYTKQDGSGRVSSPLWSVRNHADWEQAGAAARADAYAQRRTPDWSDAEPE